MGRTHIPLTVWFRAIYLCAKNKRGTSAKQFELSHKNVWQLLVRIRSETKNRDQRYMLEGLIEIDETFLAAPKRCKKRRHSTEHKEDGPCYLNSDEQNNCPMLLWLQISPGHHKIIFAGYDKRLCKT